MSEKNRIHLHNSLIRFVEYYTDVSGERIKSVLQNEDRESRHVAFAYTIPRVVNRSDNRYYAVMTFSNG